jgi:plasmid stabilization system protein ParE
MGYNLKISLRAYDDVINAIDYYDDINPDLGTRFITELYEVYEQLRNNPQFYSLISSDPADIFRDIKLQSFPYVVIFEIYEEDVVVTSVMNTNRKPLIL